MRRKDLKIAEIFLPFKKVNIFYVLEKFRYASLKCSFPTLITEQNHSRGMLNSGNIMDVRAQRPEFIYLFIFGHFPGWDSNPAMALRASKPSHYTTRELRESPTDLNLNPGSTTAHLCVLEQIATLSLSFHVYTM